MIEPEPVHTRISECGCVEAWYPIDAPACEPGLERYEYVLRPVCHDHIEGHRALLARLLAS